jgi:hypothetical protein
VQLQNVLDLLGQSDADALKSELLIGVVPEKPDVLTENGHSSMYVLFIAPSYD